MAYGFGIIDYIVVSGVLLISIHLLATSPQRLMLLLPTFLTIDFFIPFGSQLTPYRLVPLLLGGWLLLKQRIYVGRRNTVWLTAFVLAIIVALLYAIFIGDAGSRPWLRAAQYLGVFFVFVFAYQMVRTVIDVERALLGLALAAAIHGIYATYQLVASRLGLPFRGIVYDEGSDGGAGSMGIDGLLRVNGFADEPKRLGYVLFCGALALVYFYWLQKSRNRIPSYQGQTNFRFGKPAMVVLFAICVIMSLLTFASSYFIAVAISLALLAVTLSVHALKLALASLVVIMVLAIGLPETFGAYVDVLSTLLGSRTEELGRGLDTRFVYRQEFFARDYVSNDWSVLATGVGLGRYNTEFLERYGPGAGFSIDGAIMPLNSQLFEIGFDLGALGLLVFYLGGCLLAVQVGRKGPLEFVLSTSLMFMIIQSLFVHNLYLLAFVAAINAAFISSVRASVFRGQRGRQGQWLAYGGTYRAEDGLGKVRGWARSRS